MAVVTPELGGGESEGYPDPVSDPVQDPVPDPVQDPVPDPVQESGWLEERWSVMERDKADWLLRLAAFERVQGWRALGYGSGIDWLTDRLDISTTTAFEQLRVALQLERRPLLFDAFAAGRVGYSAVRAITRVKAPPEEIDAAFVEAAEHGSLRDVEHAVRHYRGLVEQETEPHLRMRSRGLRLRATGDGFCKVSGYLTAAEGAELQRHLDLMLRREEAAEAEAELPAWAEANDEFPHGNGDGEGESAGPGGSEDGGFEDGGFEDGAEFPHGNAGAAAPAAGSADSKDWLDYYAIAAQHRAERHADALMDLARMAGDGLVPRERADRYLVHLIVTPDGTATLADGTPVDPAEAAAIMCDSPHVVHVQDGDGNPLYQGRKTREWNTAQRRAALVRDGGRCRFPGCRRTNVDLHHQHWWERGGRTDIDNGFLACRYHHTLVHKHGFVVKGHPSRTLTFTRSDGREIGATNPTLRRFPAAGGPPSTPSLHG